MIRRGIFCVEEEWVRDIIDINTFEFEAIFLMFQMDLQKFSS